MLEATDQGQKDGKIVIQAIKRYLSGFGASLVAPWVDSAVKKAGKSVSLTVVKYTYGMQRFAKSKSPIHPSLVVNLRLLLRTGQS